MADHSTHHDGTRPRRRIPRGLTLVEVMLVLALLVVIAAFCWPPISRAFATQRLKKSADIVRIGWARSRVKAMNSDRVVLFRYEMNGRRFRIEEVCDFSAFADSTGAAADADSSAVLPPTDSSAPRNAGVSLNDNAIIAGGAEVLPEGIVFRAGEIENDSRAMTVNTNKSQDESILSANVSWSEPIYFYPDGTSSSARLQLGNDRSAIELTLRGLTGTVKVGDVIATEGVTP